MRSYLCLLSLCLLALAAGCKKSDLTDATDTKFKVGQRWAYWARNGEESSTLIVAKIERHPTQGVILHIGLDGLKLKDGKGIIPHMAFARDALEKSATKVLEEGAALPNYQQGYESWKKDFDKGKGSVYTVPVADAITQLEQAAAPAQ
jgi:hypothetical protein